MSSKEPINKFMDYITAKFGKKSMAIKQFRKRFEANPDSYTHFFLEFYRENKVAIETRTIKNVKLSSDEDSPFNSIDVRSLLENSKIKDIDDLWYHLDEIGRLFYTSKQKQKQKPGQNYECDETKKCSDDICGNDKSTQTVNTEKFVNDMLSKVSEHIPKNETNPMDAFLSIMKSDKLAEIMEMVTTNIKNNNIDLASLLSATQIPLPTGGGGVGNSGGVRPPTRSRSDLLSPRPRISSPPSPSMPPLIPSSPINTSAESPVRCPRNLEL